MKTIKETDPLYAPALRAASAVLGDPDVPASEEPYELGGIVVTVTMPEGATITRAPGSEGDGKEALGPADTVTLAAALLALERHSYPGLITAAMWKSCIVDSVVQKTRPKEHTPPEALRALREIEAELPKDCKRQRNTPSTLSGKAGVQISVERLPISARSHGQPANRRSTAKAH